METKKIIIIIGSIAGIFVFLLGAYYLTNKPKNTFFPDMNAINPQDQTKWNKNSKNILIEYSDFQCPACKTISGLIMDLESDSSFNKKVSSNVVYVYRNFPLDQIHPNARQAAYAAEAAGIQGKFWTMHDILFTNQDIWAQSENPSELFKKYAVELKLDISQFETDLKSSKVIDKVQKDYDSAMRAGVPGTPTFFLNGIQLDAPVSKEDFVEKLIQGIDLNIK